jgi:tRNA (cytidine32/uridine32-2'-O)-methyltransferase
LYKLAIPVKRRRHALATARMNLLQSIRAVLIQPSHPGNIGGTARALKNMGLRRLYLVAPADHRSAEATARAADAVDVLADATVCATLDEAIGDCHFVVGTTARNRRIEWPMLDPSEGAAMLLEQAQRGPVAVLFGQERSGLKNEELDRCHRVMYIPSSPEYPALNLVCAVQVVAYEMYRLAIAGISTAPTTDPPVTQTEMDHFYRHLEKVLIDINFLDPTNPRLLRRRLRRFFNRAQPDQNEMNILRGVLKQVQVTTRKPHKGSDDNDPDEQH